MNCTECAKEFSLPKNSKPTKSGLRFCSRICGINYWGRHRVKSGPDPVNPYQKRYYRCLKCGIQGKSLSGNCRKCFKELSRDKISKLPIKDFLYKNRGPTNKYTRFRELSRRIAFEVIKEPKCLICGYNKHVEVCHIKAVSAFNEDTTVGEVNSLSNLTILCPNHHYELDKGKELIPVSIADIIKNGPQPEN